MDKEEYRKKLVDVLLAFDELCKTNNLTYSLAFGTLIGAIRHHGFIPWDDDVDVMMPRKDYDKLLSLKYDTDDYKVIDCDDEPDYCYSFAKLIDKKYSLYESYRTEKCLGIYIDIFPYDYVPEVEVARKAFMQETVKKTRINFLSTCSLSAKFKGEIKLKKLLAIAVLSAKSKKQKNRIARVFNERAKSVGESKYISCTVFTQRNENKCFSKDLFNNMILVEFENHMLPAVRDYDYVLRSYYGNYMELPPVEKRVSNHNFLVEERGKK